MALRRDSSIFFCISSCFSGLTKGWYVTSTYSVPNLPSSCGVQRTQAAQMQIELVTTHQPGLSWTSFFAL